MWKMFRSKAERLGLPVRRSQAGGAEPVRDGSERAWGRLVDGLPRGTDAIRETINRKESARWARADEVLAHVRRSGEIVLGKLDHFLLGVSDDKPLLTGASARTGKTARVLKASLYVYQGSAVVLDPKGELARDTAAHRRDVLRQQVYVLDPFGCSGLPSAHFNALAEIDPSSPSAVDDIDVVAQAVILSEHDNEGSHWTNSAEGLTRGEAMYTLTLPEEDRNLVTLRQLLMLTYPPLVELREAFEANKVKDPDMAVQNALFMAMFEARDVFGGALSGTGSGLLRKNERERASIISTAETQLRFLDSPPLQAISKKSDFRLAELAERPTTIYLCLPAGRMESHFRWLRLIVRLALLALERRGTWPRGKPPILFMLEEFPTLGHMPIMEQAAAYFPGFGVKLWAVVQDLSQLKRHYPRSWGTFVGNCGVVQFFGNNDEDTLSYISDRLGSLSFVRGQFGSVGSDHAGSRDYIDKERLMYQHEIAAAFARGTDRQLLFVQGAPPMAVDLLGFDEVERLKITAGFEVEELNGRAS